MTGAPPLASPGSRVLASWWRQLTPWKPRSLWTGLLLLHRVEAAVRVSRPSRPDPLLLLVLKALALDGDGPRAPGQSLEQLDGRLQVGSQILARLLRKLQAEGLAERTAQGGWALTALGRAALERGEYLRDEYERQVFTFLDRGLAAKPSYVNLPPHLGSPWPAAEGWAFDVHLLSECLRRPPEWKRQHGFPPDVEEILGLPPLTAEEAGVLREAGPAPRDLEPWQRVILDRPEQLLAVLVLSAGEGGGERLLGFPIQQEGWILKSAEPAFTLYAGWEEVLGPAAGSPPPEQWRQAWRNWCRPRAVPLTDADSCDLARRDHRLQVFAPPRLLERLRAARSDALRGEAWVLAGEGPLRAAALLEIVEAHPAAGQAAPGGK